MQTEVNIYIAVSNIPGGSYVHRYPIPKRLSASRTPGLWKVLVHPSPGWIIGI
jgi:hypothetical protein